MAARTAVVTGATGFLGSRLCRRLARDGWRVRIVARPGSDAAALDALAPDAVLRHDGSTEALVAWMREARPDVVFHLASLFVAQHETRDVLPLVETNLAFATQVAEATARAGVTRLVNAGTSWQSFEDVDRNPVCLYAATKEAFEDVLAYYVAAEGLRVVTLRLFDTYGPGDPRPKLFRLLGRAAGSAEPVAMSPGEQRLDLVFVDDAVEAFAVAAERLLREEARGHERYALSSGAPIRLRDLVDLYGRLSGRPLPIAWGERPYRRREVMVPWRTGATLPGWAPRVGLEEGIRRVLAGERGAGSAGEAPPGRPAP